MRDFGRVDQGLISQRQCFVHRVATSINLGAHFGLNFRICLGGAVDIAKHLTLNFPNPFGQGRQGRAILGWQTSLGQKASTLCPQNPKIFGKHRHVNQRRLNQIIGIQNGVHRQAKFTQNFLIEHQHPGN